MKQLLLLMLLLSAPAHAGKIYSNQQCLQMYRAIVIDFEAGKVPPGDMMSYYSQMCIPGIKNDPERTTSVNAVVYDELVTAIKAKLAEQDLIKL